MGFRESYYLGSIFGTLIFVNLHMVWDFPPVVTGTDVQILIVSTGAVALRGGGGGGGGGGFRATWRDQLLLLLLGVCGGIPQTGSLQNPNP